MPRRFEKKVLILQVGGPAPAPPTPLVIRVVLLHTEPVVQDLCPDTVHTASYPSNPSYILSQIDY